ncbi:MAG: signal peptidase II [Firmicutes bacterium]|nr:signal peptidase II [Bacillota bacterium]
MYCVIVAVVIVILDQITKYAVVQNIPLNESIPLIEGVFHLHYIRNEGAAFSLMEGRQTFLIAIVIVVVIIVLAYGFYSRKSGSHALFWALGCVAGGGIGNLIDRARLNYVIDFFDFQVWPVFNVADIAVCVGCGLLAIYILFIEPKKRRLAESSREDV